MSLADDSSVDRILRAISALEAQVQLINSNVEQKLRYYFSYRQPIVDPGCGHILMHTKENQRIYLDERDPFISVHMLETQHWEPHVRSALRVLLQPGSTYVDVGTNIGIHSLFAYTQIGNAGRIIAIEPNPATLEVLRLNIEINALWNVVSIFPVAASNVDNAEASFECWPKYSGMSGFKDEGRVREALRIFPTMKPQSVTVQTRTVDSILRECGGLKPDVIKIDVEGFENIVLEGCVETIRSNQDVSFIIENPTSIIAKFFTDFGFQIYRTNEGFTMVDGTHFDHPTGGDYIFFNPAGKHTKPLADFAGKPFHDADRPTDDPVERELAHSRKAFFDAVKIQEQLQQEIALYVSQRDDLARQLAELKK